MAIKKIKSKIAALLVAALALQSMSVPVLATEQGTGAVSRNAESAVTQNEASGVNVAYHTQDEIRSYIENSGAKITDSVTFQENPVTEAPFALGALSTDTLDSAVRMLNQVRYIAGISYDVALDDSYNEMAQAASLVNYANDEMSHYPEKPQGMTDEMYTLAHNGAGASNIAWGSGSFWTLNYFIVMSWMEDGDDSNIDRVGHRRWLLNPSMKKTGFGLVNGEKGTHSAVYAFDRSDSEADEYGVMWPAQNMPIDYFNSKFPWSISMGTDIDENTVCVTLTRKSDGKSWSFSNSSADGAFYVDNSNYGQKGCIIFRPEGVDAYEDGDSYDVRISGLEGGDVSYTVNFFDLAPEPQVKSVAVSPSAVNVAAGKTQQFNADVTVKNGADKTVTWSVSGNKSSRTSISQTGLLTVAKEEKATALTVRATSRADTAKYGEAAVKVSGQTLGLGTSGSSNTTGETSGTMRPLPKKGKIYTIGSLKYKVTKSASKNGTVAVTAPKSKNNKTISIPSTVRISGYTFKVTAIANKAFKNNKKLKKVTIGNNVKSIGQSAFGGDKKLNAITINTAKLKTVKAGSFKGIAKKAKVTVPKGKAKEYRKLLKKGGLPSKASVKQR